MQTACLPYGAVHVVSGVMYISIGMNSMRIVASLWVPVYGRVYISIDVLDAPRFYIENVWSVVLLRVLCIENLVSMTLA